MLKLPVCSVNSEFDEHLVIGSQDETSMFVQLGYAATHTHACITYIDEYNLQLKSAAAVYYVCVP
jgi:hypothetical protein